MHGRGKMASAPASDAATRKGRCCLSVCEASKFFFFFFCFSARADSRGIGLTRADSGCIGPYWLKPPIHTEIKKKSAKRTKEVVVTRT